MVGEIYELKTRIREDIIKEEIAIQKETDPNKKEKRIRHLEELKEINKRILEYEYRDNFTQNFIEYRQIYEQAKNLINSDPEKYKDIIKNIIVSCHRVLEDPNLFGDLKELYKNLLETCQRDLIKLEQQEKEGIGKRVEEGIPKGIDERIEWLKERKKELEEEVEKRQKELEERKAIEGSINILKP